MAPLDGSVMLPFRLWRVADLMDGQRTLEDLAAGAALSLEDARGAVAAIERELDVRPTETVTPTPSTAEAAPPDRAAPPSGAALIELLIKTAVELVGPVGEVLVEDALDDLGENAAAAELISCVALELREPQRGVFLARLFTKGLT